MRTSPVDVSLLKDIKKVYEITSIPLHERLEDEKEFKELTSSQFVFLMEILKMLLVQIYVEPTERDNRRKKLSTLSKKIKGFKSAVTKKK